MLINSLQGDIEGVKESKRKERRGDKEKNGDPEVVAIEITAIAQHARYRSHQVLYTVFRFVQH